MNNWWILFTIAVPMWIFAWYMGRVILINQQKRAGMFRHCPFCGKEMGKD